MNRITAIMEHPDYQMSLKKIKTCEENRPYCRHTFEHFLDVARITYIRNLEQNAGYAKDIIYACGLLHDIGRHLEYTHGISHETASAAIAEKILPECGFHEAECTLIITAIKEHRGKAKKAESTNLSSLLYESDKLSRNCFCCSAIDDCNWSTQRKNLTVTY